MEQFLEDSDARTRKRDRHSFSSGGRSSSEVSQIKGIYSFIRFFGLDTTIVENEQLATSLCRQLEFWGTRKISCTLEDDLASCVRILQPLTIIFRSRLSDLRYISVLPLAHWLVVIDHLTRKSPLIRRSTIVYSVYPVKAIGNLRTPRKYYFLLDANYLHTPHPRGLRGYIIPTSDMR